MEDPTRKLIDELHSLLDEATILSISSDYDLQNPQEFATAREILLALSLDVEAEEATGFNPSGFGSNELTGISLSDGGAGYETLRAIEGDVKSSDGLTTTTEDSRSYSPSVLSGTSSKASVLENLGLVHVSAFDNLTDDEKERQLAALFVNLKPVDIRLTLQKTKGNIDLAMDALLNIQFLDETGQRPKGVDGFFVSDDEGPKEPKGKKKGRKRTYKPLKLTDASKVEAPKSPDMDAASKAPVQDEVVGNDDIVFISNRFELPISEVKGIYERNKSSLGAAILAILDEYIALNWQYVPSPDELRKINEQEVRVPWIPHDYFCPIFDMTPTSEAAIDVIDALAGHFKKPVYLKHHVTYRIVTSEQLGPASGTPSSSRPPTGQRAHTSPTTLRDASAAKATISASMSHSFAAASSAYRRGKSNGLMGQAAAFYADRARAAAARHRDAISAEADLRVDKQSEGDMIDLHGVSVSDGVRIALDRVWRWWNALSPEDRTGKSMRDDGFKVITGAGRHNPGGKSPLRENVFKALAEDGWKFEKLTGACQITGRNR